MIGKEKKVCKLINSLYNLKQAPCTHKNLIAHLLKLNFKKCNLNVTTLFVNKVRIFFVYLVVYVDDLLMTRNNESYIATINKELKKGFEMTYSGFLHDYFRIELNILRTYSYP